MHCSQRLEHKREGENPQDGCHQGLLEEGCHQGRRQCGDERENRPHRKVEDIHRLGRRLQLGSPLNDRGAEPEVLQHGQVGDSDRGEPDDAEFPRREHTGEDRHRHQHQYLA